MFSDELLLREVPFAKSHPIKKTELLLRLIRGLNFYDFDTVKIINFFILRRRINFLLLKEKSINLQIDRSSPTVAYRTRCYSRLASLASSQLTLSLDYLTN